MSPRANDGTVTLVAGNPVVADTDIVTTWANPTMADIAAMLQDSLSRSGKGTMLTAFPFADGVVAAPSISFKSELTSGFYRPGAGQIALSILGVQKALAAATLFTLKTAAKVEGALESTGNMTVGGDLAVTGSMGITRPDLPAVGQQVSASSGNYAGTTSTSPVDVTNLTVTITTTGRPVMLMLQSDGTAGPAQLGATVGAAAGAGCFQFSRASTSLGVSQIYAPANTPISIPGMTALDVVVAGTYTYKFQAFVTVNTITAVCSYMKLVAFEL